MDKITNTRCVVTGLGMISAIGNNVDECFANALAGKTGIDKVALLIQPTAMQTLVQKYTAIHWMRSMRQRMLTVSASSA